MGYLRHILDSCFAAPACITNLSGQMTAGHQQRRQRSSQQSSRLLSSTGTGLQQYLWGVKAHLALVAKQLLPETP